MNDPKMSIRSIRNHALAIKRMHGLKLLVVDQLTHIRTDSRHKSKFDRYEEVTSESKSMAFEIGCPILILAQRTRTSQRRDDPTPQIDDADANSIERDADMVLAVWQEYNWLQRNKPDKRAGGEAWDAYESKLRSAKGRASIIGLKVRSGEPYQQRDLMWHGATTRFSDFTAT
jgi:replicative DNA helicase